MKTNKPVVYRFETNVSVIYFDIEACNSEENCYDDSKRSTPEVDQFIKNIETSR